MYIKIQSEYQLCLGKLIYNTKLQAYYQEYVLLYYRYPS